MQVVETLSQGLKREYKVTLAAGDLAARLEGQLNDLKTKVKINGFRPGKVPVSHLRKVYGRSVMAEIVETAVNEANGKIVEEHGLRLAQRPKVDFSTDRAEMEQALEAKGDLAFSVALEVLPKFEVGAFDDIALERPTAEVGEEEVTRSLERLAERNRTYADKDGAAAKGDKVTMDFTGAIDGVAFDGGSGTDTDIVLGSGSFIPGFEDQMDGIAAGESRVVKVTFPEAYGAAHLAGKSAEFAVTAKKIAAPSEVALDDEMAKGFGLDSIDKLRETIRNNIVADFARASRDKLKRKLLDALDKRYSFDLPEGLVGSEFNNIWAQVEAEQKQTGKTFADENTTEEAARADYRKIAERRVRLGLLLAEVGEQTKVQVSDDEVTGALVERARQFPGQEKVIWDFYRKNPERMAEVRAPIFEEKVVDHIISLAKVTDLTVSKEDLFKPDDEDVKG